jgi:hypothetical protein
MVVRAAGLGLSARLMLLTAGVSGKKHSRGDWPAEIRLWAILGSPVSLTGRGTGAMMPVFIRGLAQALLYRTFCNKPKKPTMAHANIEKHTCDTEHRDTKSSEARKKGYRV